MAIVAALTLAPGIGACTGVGGGPPPLSGMGIELEYRLPGAGLAETGEVVKTVSRRLELAKISGVAVLRTGEGEFLVRIPREAAAGIERIKGLLETPGELWFKIVAPRQNTEEIERLLDLKEKNEYDRAEETFDVALKESDKGVPLPKEDPVSYTLVESKGAISGRLLKRAYPAFDQFNNPSVGFTWSAEGARLFGDLTESHKGHALAIIFDGVIKSAPHIEERIGAKGIIRGRFTKQEVDDLVAILGGGTLSERPVLQSEKTTTWGPEKGSGKPEKQTKKE